MRVTFDFDKNEVTDDMTGTQYIPGLRERMADIYKAAGMEIISGAELRKDINALFEEMGADIRCAEPDEFYNFLRSVGYNDNGAKEVIARIEEGRADRTDMRYLEEFNSKKGS